MYDIIALQGKAGAGKDHMMQAVLKKLTEKGHIAECGSHEELVNLGGIYHDLVMAQRQTAKLKN